MQLLDRKRLGAGLTAEAEALLISLAKEKDAPPGYGG